MKSKKKLSPFSRPGNRNAAKAHPRIMLSVRINSDTKKRLEKIERAQKLDGLGRALDALALAAGGIPTPRPINQNAS